MATNTVRVDDKIQSEVTEIAGELGLTFNAVVNVFLREFVRHRGFPFPVVVSDERRQVSDMNAREIEALCQKAVLNRSGVAVAEYVTYPESDGKIYKHFPDGRKEEVDIV